MADEDKDKAKEQADLNFKNKAIDTIRNLQTENKRLNQAALSNKNTNTKASNRKPILAKLKKLGDKVKTRKRKKVKRNRKLLKKK
jgi:hypothetical protein